MQTSNSRYVECSPDSAVGKLPLQASALFVGGQKQLAVALSIAELLLGKLTAEETVTARFNGRRIVALCSYAGAECNEQQQMSEVMHAHHCAFEWSEPRRTAVRGLSVFSTLIAGSELI